MRKYYKKSKIIFHADDDFPKKKIRKKNENTN